MAEAVHPDYARFVAEERRAQRLGPAPPALAAGEPAEPVRVPGEAIARLAPEAARRASGFFRPTTRTEVLWVEGDSQLAVGIGAIRAEPLPGAILVTIPVRCDQTRAAEVFVTFAVGDDKRPAGLHVATPRRPRGPELVVETWGDALVAFAWGTVLELVTGVAAAVGKDARGNLLVPGELRAGDGAVVVLPMARHRFAGGTGLGA